MEFPQHGHMLMALLRPFNLEIASELALETVFDSGLALGLSRDEIEDALIGASANGWVIAVGTALRLTRSGHSLLYPANDNVV